MRVRDAIRAELHNHHQCLKQLSSQMEKLCASKDGKRSCKRLLQFNAISDLTATISHQRLMAMSDAEIRRRLLNNEQLHSLLDAAVNNVQLQSLHRIISRRVDGDKLALTEYSAIKHWFTGTFVHEIVQCTSPYNTFRRSTKCKSSRQCAILRATRVRTCIAVGRRTHNIAASSSKPPGGDTFAN